MSLQPPSTSHDATDVAANDQASPASRFVSELFDRYVAEIAQVHADLPKHPERLDPDEWLHGVRYADLDSFVEEKRHLLAGHDVAFAKSGLDALLGDLDLAAADGEQSGPALLQQAGAIALAAFEGYRALHDGAEARPLEDVRRETADRFAAAVQSILPPIVYARLSGGLADRPPLHELPAREHYMLNVVELADFLTRFMNVPVNIRKARRLTETDRDRFTEGPGNRLYITEQAAVAWWTGADPRPPKRPRHGNSRSRRRLN